MAFNLKSATNPLAMSEDLDRILPSSLLRHYRMNPTLTMQGLRKVAAGEAKSINLPRTRVGRGGAPGISVNKVEPREEPRRSASPALTEVTAEQPKAGPPPEQPSFERSALKRRARKAAGLFDDEQFSY